MRLACVIFLGGLAAAILSPAATPSARADTGQTPPAPQAPSQTSDLPAGSPPANAPSNTDPAGSRNAPGSGHPAPPRDASDLDPELLAPVQHKTLGILDAERDPYYRVLQQARDADPARLRAAARRNIQQRRAEVPQFRDASGAFPLFVDIFKNPEQWHGRLVTLRGHVRRVVSYPAGENAFGLTTLYEAWLYTEDSQTNPAVVVCSSIPEGMPTGDQMTEEASVTGYFFKIYGYRAQDTTRIAPLILAQRLEWHPVEAPSTTLFSMIVGGIVLAAVLAAIAWQWTAAQRDRARRAERHREELPQTLDSFRQPGNDEPPPGASDRAAPDG